MKKKSKKKKKFFERNRISKDEATAYDYHQPVLPEEAVDLLVTDAGGIYVDGTLGGGGHAAEILKRLNDKGKVFAFDKDAESVQHCRKRFWGEPGLNDAAGRLEIYNLPYEEAWSIKGLRGNVKGFLLDLGVSSRQLDESRRGFTYRADANLDMRFGPQGRTAAEILHAASEEEIESILRRYGEEPFSRVIARRIVEKRRAAIPISSTFALREIVENCVPNHLRYKSLSRVFQALRIAVNDELATLERTLSNCPELLAQGGRIVVISYHSLEDRTVKSTFKELTKKHYDDDSANAMPSFKILTKKPIVPSEAEIRTNPRARSAKLRAVEKL